MAALALAGTAAGQVRVDSTAGFNAAVDRIGNRAGTIVLARGTFGPLRVGPRSRHARWLTIRATRGAKVRWLELRGVHRVRIVNVRFRPRFGRSSMLLVKDSRRVRVEHVDVRGLGRMARIRIRHSADVSLRSVEMRRCRVLCLRADNTARLVIVDGWFHDCFGCDFFLAWGVVGMVIRRSAFERALPGPCGIDTRTRASQGFFGLDAGNATGKRCNHQDLLQLIAGRDWLIEGNRFGLYQGGAAQVYLSGSAGPTDNVIVRGNRFEPGDERVPGVYAANGIIVGNPPGFPGLPTRVVIESNEILSGAPRLYDPPTSPWYLMANAVVLSENYQRLPEELRPLVRDNVYGSMTHPQYCDPLAQGGVCG